MEVHKTTHIQADATLHYTRVCKQRPSNRQLRRAETAKMHSDAQVNPALADSEAAVDSALQDADQLPPRPDLIYGLLGLGFVIPKVSCVMLLLLISE